MPVDLPDGVTAEMLEASQRGEDVRLPDGRRVHLVRAHAPLSGEYGPWRVHVMPVEDNGLPSIRLSPDYGAPVPLWPQSIAAMVPTTLMARLIDWQRDFESNCRSDSEWKSEEAKARWAEQASVLEVDLRVALEGRAEVIVDLWPL